MSEPKITAKCECGSVFRLAAKYTGKTVKCPNCGAPVPIRGASPPPRRTQPKPQYADDEWGDEDDWEDEPAPAGSRSRESSRKSAGRQTRKKSKGWSTTTIVLTVVGAGVFLVFAVCAGMVYVGFGKLQDVNIYANQPDFGEPTELFPVAEYPVPSFAAAKVASDKFVGVTETVRLVRFSDGDDHPGFGMRMRIYMPGGEHAPGSLPCVLVAPAGTNLMVGNLIDEGSYHDETLPYATAGMVAVMYSLDGPLLDTAGDEQFRKAYLKFRAAAGGVVNGRNALEYVLENVPEVDSKKIYAAGHSSAANVSLLLAVHEPRISACIAYAPAADVESELADVINDPAAKLLLPKLDDFLKQSNPMTHAARFKCPVFLFHARDDSNTPFANTEKLANAIRAAGSHVVFAPVDQGNHYESMIQAGIPQAIKWLKSLD